MNYKFNEKQFFSDIAEGIAIIIEMEEGVYFGLNPFSTELFENIINGADTEELLTALSLLPGYKAVMKERYVEFVQGLLSRKMITEDTAPPSPVHLGISEVPEDPLNFVISEYKGATDLLLADPIHQVKSEIGWGPMREVLK